jgi:hypothetical protein
MCQSFAERGGGKTRGQAIRNLRVLHYAGQDYETSGGKVKRNCNKTKGKM